MEGVQISIRVDTTAVQQALKALSDQEIPTALRNAINDVAREAIKAEQDEMRNSFDRPTPFILRGMRLKQKATKEDPTAVIWFKDVYEEKGGRDFVLSTVSPHIPGFADTRSNKGMERALMRIGLMQKGQYLMPSRTMRLDRYGNVPGSTASKMLNDIGAFAGVSGFTSTTHSAKVKYVWAEVKSRSGGTVKGIWLKSALRSNAPSGALQMMVVNKPPRYRKRFDFYGVAQRTMDTRALGHVTRAVKKAIDRRTR